MWGWRLFGVVCALTLVLPGLALAERDSTNPGDFARESWRLSEKDLRAQLILSEQDADLFDSFVENFDRLLGCYFATYYQARRSDYSFTPRIQRNLTRDPARVSVAVLNIRDEFDRDAFERIHAIVELVPDTEGEAFELNWYLQVQGLQRNYYYVAELLADVPEDEEFDTHKNAYHVVSSSTNPDRAKDFAHLHFTCLQGFLMRQERVGVCDRMSGAYEPRVFGHAERVNQCRPIRGVLQRFSREGA